MGTLNPTEDPIYSLGVALDVTGQQLVVARNPPDRLEWWQLDPLRLINTRLLSDGKVLDLQSSPAAQWFAVVSQAGVRLWDFQTREPLPELITGASDIHFSPSGLRFVTLSETSMGPYPGIPQPMERTVTLWQVSE